MASKSEREYRAMTVTIATPEERAEGEESYIVEGYASTFDEPYKLYSDDEVEVWEKVAPTAFDEADLSDVIMQYDHQGRVFARIKNNTLALSTDEVGLFTRANLGGTDLGRGLYQEIAGGYTDKMSYGFTVAEDSREIDRSSTEKTKIVRTITKVAKVYDVSAVSLPANPGTSISARFLDGAIEDARAERLKALELEEKRKRLEVRAKALKGVSIND